VRVPLMDPKSQLAPARDQLLAAIGEVVESNRFILGPVVQEAEQTLAAYVGAAHGVGVGNGTDALAIALRALGVEAGDEVICPSFTFYATAEAIVRAGATPVFADIEPATLNLDPDDAAAKVSDRTKAIMPVHLFGRPADLEPLRGLGVPIIEDAAQAFGARGVATVGIASTFSFFPTKNLFALGDGGLVAATDEDLADRVRMLRFHGSKDKKSFSYIGTNSRLDELQAAVLRLFLGELDGWNRARREAAARYADLGLGEFCALPEDEPGHVYHMYVVRSPERARLAEALAAAGIANASYYVTPLHLQPPLQQAIGREQPPLPETERASRENLALPMWAGIPEETQEQVVSVIREASVVGAAS
jgi:dTDP-3-amino-3,4,6-trideoxy-alpha-D-glucose transaminase